MVEHKLNVKKVAGMLHVSPSCVYNWHNGYSPMPNKQLTLLEEKLDALKPSGRTLVMDDDWAIR